MTNITLEIFIILLLILINGLFAMSEIAIVSARKTRLQQAADSGNTAAKTALDLLQKPTRFLSTVQVGITLVGIWAGAFGGATLAEELEPLIAQITFLAPYSETISVVIVVILITYFSLILGELAPKQIALNYAEQIAINIAPFMSRLAWLASPIVFFLSFSTEALLRILGIKSSLETVVSEEDVKMMIEQGTQEGVFEPIEEKMVGQLFRLGDQKVYTLITPRPEVVWLNSEDSLEELRQKIIENSYSRYPVGRGSLDDILGVIIAKDLLIQNFKDEPFDLESLIQPALFVPEGLPAFDLLQRFKETRTKIAIVIDEYGSMEGIVTLNDILTAIVGELPDADDTDPPPIVRRQDGSWLVDGMLLIDQFQETFALKELPSTTERYYQTVGGFVLAALGHIPTAGEYFNWESYRIEVMDMDEKRVDKILLTSQKENPSSSENR